MLPQFSQDLDFEFGKGILGVIDQISHFLPRKYWMRECDSRLLRLSGAFDFSKAGAFHKFMDLDFGWEGDHHMFQDTFQKRKQDITSHLLDWMVIQHNIRFSRTSNQRYLWKELLLEGYELSKTLVSIRKIWLSHLALVYVYLSFDMVLLPQDKSILWNLQKALRCAGASEGLMRLSRGALERSLTRLLGRMSNKVQEWLRSGIDALSTEENNLESLESYRRSPLSLMGVNASSANVMDLDQDEMIGEDAPSYQESFSVMEVNEGEPDEGLSVVTDLRSSRYRITYTENTESGMALFR